MDVLRFFRWLPGRVEVGWVLLRGVLRRHDEAVAAPCEQSTKALLEGAAGVDIG
jgi:hypothetical protein